MESNRKKVLGRALIFQLFLYITENLMVMLMSGLGSRVLLIETLIMNIIVFALPLYYYRKNTGYIPFLTPVTEEHNEALGRRLNIVIMYIIALSLTVTAVNVFGMMGELIVKTLGADVADRLPDDIFSLVVIGVRSVIFAAFLEESLFRGAVIHAYADESKIKTVLVSAGLFALMHYGFLSMIYAFAAGLVIAYFAILTHSIAFAFAVHLGSNLMTFVFTALRMQLGEKVITISNVTAIIFAVISVVSIVTTAGYYFKKRAKEDKKAKQKEKSEVCAEIVVYSVLAFILCIINI